MKPWKTHEALQIKNRQQRAVILLYYSDLFLNSQQRDLYWLGIGGWVGEVCLLPIFSGTPCGQMIISPANQSWRKKWGIAWPFNVWADSIADGSQAKINAADTACSTLLKKYIFSWFVITWSQHFFFCQINLNHLCSSDNIIFWVSDD